MSNPTFRDGPITFTAVERVEAGRLVQLTATGVKHAETAQGAFGAVTNPAEPEAARPESSFLHGTPHTAAVFSAPATVPLEVDGTATDIKTGTQLEVGTDGKAKAHGSGVVVAVAIRDGSGSTVQARLLTPVNA